MKETNNRAAGNAKEKNCNRPFTCSPTSMFIEDIIKWVYGHLVSIVYMY